MRVSNYLISKVWMLFNQRDGAPKTKTFFSLWFYIVVYLGLDELHLVLISLEPLMEVEISDRNISSTKKTLV